MDENTKNASTLICHGEQKSHPKVFQPSNQWQVIHHDQEIPKGIHVKIDINTGVKEGKLIDEKDDVSNNEQKSHLSVVQDLELDPSIDDTEELLLDEADSDYDNKSYSLMKDFIENMKFNAEDQNSLELAISTLTDCQFIDNESVSKALSTLRDLSYDLIYGEKITGNKKLIQSLQNLIEKSDHVDEKSTYQKKESCLRIISSSVRNNPKAANNLLSNYKDIVPYLISQLKDTVGMKSDKVTDATLSVIGSLISTKTFLIEFRKLRGLEIIKDIFVNEFHEKILDVFLDLSRVDSIDEELKHFQADIYRILEKQIVEIDDENNIKKLLYVMIEIKKELKSAIKVDFAFIKWLDNKLENENTIKNRDFIW
ncbi:Sil1p ASCRUDRAFT_6782 [Ascoidea rubescens DSM 1968]|uniref:Nucleotide exchange factor SIL1 n=1 Tax=Ascoidea rubescens DSM 1968 TaxID=1344418 RepID=A0A1D2VKL8_9ASCO|nr:hypothetical protein ASCRUDRAFT_6782 [Ascoidea rubescens DSM 1968]ODV62154.1 hypothetical protein ASCRUDRAFT_6782 [Ascoidea rubescens DSM 1968]